MNRDFTVDELRRCKLMIGVPMYGGQCLGTFTQSMIHLTSLCNQYGIHKEEFFLFNESLITRARNYVTEKFMKSDCTHLMFIDADIGFNPLDVICLLGLSGRVTDVEDQSIIARLEAGEKIQGYSLFETPDRWMQLISGGMVEIQDPNVISQLNMAPPDQLQGFQKVGAIRKWVQESPYDIIGGAYPKKTISWEKVKAAVDKGFADENPEHLAAFVGDYVFNPKGGPQEIKIQEACEVLEIGTGFMMIRRSTLERFNESYPEYLYTPDHVRSADFDGSKKIMQYFQAEIVNDRYLSEDYWFTQKCHDLGLKTWLCPWMELNHTGSYVFGGSLAALAAIGASATADAGALNKGHLAGD